jgi:nicotinamidase-related amidase
MLRKRLLLPLATLAAVLVYAAPTLAQTIIDEWPSVKAPPAPELKAVTLDPKTTALLVMDLVKQTVPSVPIADTLPAVAPKANDPIVAAAVDKFILGNQDTGLERMLKDKGITSIITVGTAAHGAVLYTASAAALRGFNVIVPVDGMSGDGQNTFIEQYVAYNLTSAPVISSKITLTRIDMIKF